VPVLYMAAWLVPTLLETPKHRRRPNDVVRIVDVAKSGVLKTTVPRTASNGVKVNDVRVSVDASRTLGARRREPTGPEA
jgi:hypothetical protein